MSHGERRDRLPGRGIRPLPDRIPGGDAPVDWDAGNAVRPIPRPSHRGPLRGGRGPNDVFELNRRRLRNGAPRPQKLHAFFDRRRQCPGGRERDRRVPQSRRSDHRPAELQPDRLRPSPNRPKQRASDAGGFGSPGSLPLLLPCPGRRHVGAKHPGRRTLGEDWESLVVRANWSEPGVKSNARGLNIWFESSRVMYNMDQTAYAATRFAAAWQDVVRLLSSRPRETSRRILFSLQSSNPDVFLRVQDVDGRQVGWYSTTETCGGFSNSQIPNAGYS